MASKYRLNPEELLVESFDTEAMNGEKGTVLGHNHLSQSTCIEIMCGCTYAVGPGMGTCDLSCMEPCEPTNINCGGGGSAGCSGAATCGCPMSDGETCCTGRQLECSCMW